MDVVDAIVEGIRLAVTKIPEDVIDALKSAYEKEESDVARYNLELILRAIEISRENSIPVCQDTGTPIFFVKVGEDFTVKELSRAIKEAVNRATEEIPLRPNAISLLTGKVIGNSPEIHFEEGRTTRISILMKGGGSENCSSLFTLTPAQGFEGVKEEVIKRVRKCGGKPCPPVILGIGIASPAEKAMRLAKIALLRKIGERSKHKMIANLEREILREVNSLGIGPMGLGGKTTALDVKIEVETRHPASFIAALSVQCWAHRRAFIEFTDGGVRIWQ
ncbi:fumarate hydratase [Pyrococcus sp. ST04]|uniref:fumarate hydratase n=1 Tax=Pyrococcus sp. ST04 TaxID=1183377 RepID=UPI0002605E15|nr:fumarate hydratase [Pyrococcus sp. ST04]AFK23145.1 fumarate hydratase (fumarase) alpha subunit [Pyrococcus sp. ST04]